MKLLAIDTCLGNASVAVMKDGKLLAEKSCADKEKIAEKLVIIIEEVLEKAKTNYNDLNLIVSTIGPGSFTGARIGLSSAKAVAMVANIPIIGITTFDAFAYHAANHLLNDHKIKKMLVVINAMRDQIYGQFFNCFNHLPKISSKGPPFMADYQDIKNLIEKEKILITGNSKEIVEKELTRKHNFEITENLVVAASDVGMMGFYKTRFGKDIKSEGNIVPIYIRKPDAKISKTQCIVEKE